MIEYRKILLGLYIAVFCICAWTPYDRSVWFAENIPIVLLVILLIVVSKYYRFTNKAYTLMFILPVLHTIGGHFTFELVPFDYITDLFDFERNHYDRIAHFSVGLYAYPLAEIMSKRGWVANRFVAVIFAVCVILSIASLYEMFEWIYAICAEPSAGLAVLGSQGDIWDAQKDMLADGLGAVFSGFLFMCDARISKNS